MHGHARKLAPAETRLDPARITGRRNAAQANNQGGKHAHKHIAANTGGGRKVKASVPDNKKHNAELGVMRPGAEVPTVMKGCMKSRSIPKLMLKMC